MVGRTVINNYQNSGNHRRSIFSRPVYMLARAGADYKKLSRYYLIRWLAVSLLLAADAGVALAESANAITEPVTGRAPTARPVISASGNVLTILLGFNDDDYDGLHPPDTLFQWFNNGVPIPRQDAGALWADPDDGFGGDIITVTVRPATDPEITDPAVGDVVSSGQYRVPPGRIMSRFLRPGSQSVGPEQAKSNCKSRGARLPTAAELQELYKDATRARVAPDTANYDIQDLYGWLVESRGMNLYWTSKEGKFFVYEAVMLDTGTIMTFNPRLGWDACIKD